MLHHLGFHKSVLQSEDHFLTRTSDHLQFGSIANFQSIAPSGFEDSRDRPVHLMSQSFEFSMLTPVHQWMHKFPGNSLSMSEFHFIVKLFWVLWLWLKFLPKTCVNFYAGKVEPYWKENERNERTQLIFVRFFYGRFFLAIFGIWGLEFKDNMRNNNLSGVPK